MWHILLSFHSNARMKVAETEILPSWKPSSNMSFPQHFKFGCPSFPSCYIKVHIMSPPTSPPPSLLLPPDIQVSLSLQHGKNNPPKLALPLLTTAFGCACWFCGFPLQQSFNTVSTLLSHPKSVVSPLLQHGSINPQQCLVSRQPSSTSPSPLPIFVPLFLGPNNCWVMGSVWQCSILAVVEEAVAPATIADEEEGSQEDQGTDGAGLPLQ